MQDAGIVCENPRVPASSGAIEAHTTGAKLISTSAPELSDKAGQPRRDCLGRSNVVFGQLAIDDQCREAMDEGPACQGNIARIGIAVEEFPDYALSSATEIGYKTGT